VFPQRVHGVCQAATASGARSQDFNGEEQTSRYQNMDRTYDRAIRIASDDTATRETQKRYLTPFTERMIERFGLQATTRQRGRPRKGT